MSIKNILSTLLLCAGLCFALACSDDDGPGPVADSGPGGDGPVVAKDGTQNPDQTVEPDISVPKVCEAECVKQALYLCNKSTAGKCQECSKDEHCTGNPGSLGAKCTSKFCGCSKDADCAGKLHGTKCSTKDQFCGCAVDADCAAPARCLGTLFGAKVCKQPCKSNADCTSTSAPYCATNGKCVACLNAGHCANTTMPKCDTTTGTCAKCTAHADCANSLYGMYCDTKAGTCGCQSEGHCKNRGWGNKCDTTLKRCACKSNAECSGNANGPKCYTDFNKCSCAANADCKKAPYSKCYKPYSGALYNHCQAACKTSLDCPPDLNVCNATLSKCVECKINNDCKGTSSKYCNSTTGSCFQCKSDVDCASSTYKICDTGTGMCSIECKADKDCTSSTTKKFCSTTLKKCVACKANSHCTSDATKPFCDSGSGSCAECSTDANCKTGYKWGNKCVSGTSSKSCRCKANSDCAGNPNGPTCYATYSKCSCTANSQCTKAPYLLCELPYSGASYKHCQKKCTKNADCTGTSKTCDTKTGKCVACLADKDCTSTTYKFCNATLGKCVACKAHSDCASNTATPYCDSATGSCSQCATDANCKTGYKWGNKCVSGTSSKSCLCKANTDCAGNPNGPTCYTTYSKCSCTADSQCTKAPYKKCLVPYSGATYKHCQISCTADKDCASNTSNPYCNATSGKCVECKTNAHCAKNQWTKICDATNGCVECTTDAHCTNTTLGNKCNTSGLYCECSADADCKANVNGKKCNTSAGACSCAADTDCPTGKKCTGSTSFGTKYCK